MSSMSRLRPTVYTGFRGLVPDPLDTSNADADEDLPNGCCRGKVFGGRVPRAVTLDLGESQP